MTHEPGADGKPQLLIDGVAPVTQTDRDRWLIEQKKAAPMRGGNAPADFGLFSDEKDQTDFIPQFVREDWNRRAKYRKG